MLNGRSFYKGNLQSTGQRKGPEQKSSVDLSSQVNKLPSKRKSGTTTTGRQTEAYVTFREAQEVLAKAELAKHDR